MHTLTAPQHNNKYLTCVQGKLVWGASEAERQPEMKLPRSVSLVLVVTLWGSLSVITAADSSCDSIKSGQTVGIKMTYRNKWLSCSGTWCDKKDCPERYFSKSNSECWGEVFRIYSQPAKGKDIKVGDKVGLYYPREAKWFGCSARHCGKYTCPGNPTHNYGFADNQKWHQCGGEVFTIYAFGKGIGDVIVPKDIIMLRFGHLWVSLWDDPSDKRVCPGFYLPPNKRKYDQCGGEAFEIYKL